MTTLEWTADLSSVAAKVMFESTPLLVKRVFRITFRACSSVPVTVTAGKQLFISASWGRRGEKRAGCYRTPLRAGFGMEKMVEIHAAAIL